MTESIGHAALSKAWREANPEKRRAQKRRWYAKHRAEILAKKNAAYASDAVKRCAKLKEQRQANPERLREQQRQQRLRHPEKHRARVAAWKADNRERVYAACHARRASYRGTYTNAEWAALCAEHDHRCVGCGEREPLTRDHIQPLSAGGSNTIDNIQPLCLSCNLSKGRRTVDYRSNMLAGV